MDYKELANLIFPDAKDISYYEEKYPERNLPEGAIVTRFAPSPTGFVHIGGLYQSLIARKLASQTNGVFFLRVEDTDQKREVENAVSGIVSSLKDFLKDNYSELANTISISLIWDIVEVCQECSNSVTAYDNIRVKTEKCFRNIKKRNRGQRQVLC